MPTLAALAIAMTLLVSLLLLALRTKHAKPLEWILKPLAALTFVLAGLWLGALETRWGTVLFLGLVLAAIGDVLLIPKSKGSFLAGLVSFLLGHVAYAIAFAVRGISIGWTVAALALMLVLAVPVLRWLWPHVEQKMRAPVAAYITVITGMVALAAGTFGAHGGVLVLVGAVGFYLSDLAVARERFVKSEHANRLWGLPLYFGAQLVLAASTSSGMP